MGVNNDRNTPNSESEIISHFFMTAGELMSSDHSTVGSHSLQPYQSGWGWYVQAFTGLQAMALNSGGRARHQD